MARTTGAQFSAQVLVSRASLVNYSATFCPGFLPRYGLITP